MRGRQDRLCCDVLASVCVCVCVCVYLRKCVPVCVSVSVCGGEKRHNVSVSEMTRMPFCLFASRAVWCLG